MPKLHKHSEVAKRNENQTQTTEDTRLKGACRSSMTEEKVSQYNMLPDLKLHSLKTRGMVKGKDFAVGL